MVTTPEQFGKIVAVPVMIRIAPKERLQILNQDDWQQFWRQRVDQDYGVKLAPPVDFSRTMVVAATLGRGQGCDWWMKIDSLVYTPTVINVFVSGGRARVGTVCGPYRPWQPWDAIWVPRSTAPIEWHEYIVPTP
jgi:hypothetical protein